MQDDLRHSRVVTPLARLLAFLGFAYFANVMAQTGFITVREIIIGSLWVVACLMLSLRVSAVMILMLGFGVSLSWGVFSESVPISDFAAFQAYAEQFRLGDYSCLMNTKSPPSVIYYGFFHFLFGSSYLTNYLASSLAWTAGAAVFYRASLLFLSSRLKARFILAGLVFYPATILFSPVISSDAVFFLLSSCMVLSLVQLIRTGHRRGMLLLGGLVGALFLTRGQAIVYLASLVIFAALGLSSRGAGLSRQPGSLPGRLGFRELGLVVVSCAMVVGLYGGISQVSGRGFRVSPNEFSSYVFMSGTNRASGGKFNQDDLALAGFVCPNKRSDDEASRVARTVALGRIRQDVAGFMKFALTDKVSNLWRDNYYSFGWTIKESPARARIEAMAQSVIHSCLDGTYVLLIGVFVVLMAYRVFVPRIAILWWAVPLAGFATIYLFTEVQGRYHQAMMPFILIPSLIWVFDFLRDRLVTLQESD